MKGRKNIKKGLTILFITLQCLFLILSLFIALLSLTLYIKLKDYLQLSYKPLIISLVLSIFYLGLSIIGIMIVLKRRKTFVFIHEIGLVILMNMDILILSMEYSMVRNTVKYTNDRWEKLSKEQKLHVQDKLGCCGFKDKDDRGEGKCEGVGCRDVFIGIVEGIRKKSTRFIIAVFMVKSLDLAITGMMNVKRKKKRVKGKFSRIEIK